MLNPKFGVLGMLSYPFWFFYEWLAPLIEFFGLLYFTFLCIMGWVNWEHFLLLLALVYSYAVTLSWFTLLMEEITYREYKGYKSLFVLLGVALVEPFLFHPIGVWAAVKGNWDKFVRRKNSWGAQTRVGFNASNTEKKS